MPRQTQETADFDNLFKGLVENACRFVELSVKQFKERDEHSLINFYTGLELFLKARLMKEHWSLLVQDAQKANREKFAKGDFASPGYEQLVDRLRNIAGVGISKEMDRVCNELRKHRNKQVHFFHDVFSKGDMNEVLGILIDQGKAWYHLNELLTKKWAAFFTQWKDRIDRLNWLMHRDPAFLKAKYDLIKPFLDELEANGAQIKDCTKCHQRAAEYIELLDGLSKLYCHVCFTAELVVPCPGCGKLIILDSGSGVCESCGGNVDVATLVARFDPFDHESGEGDGAWCGSCDYTEKSVVPCGEADYGPKYICLACAEEFGPEDVDQCQYCGDLNAGVDLSLSYLNGCGGCDGKDPDKM